jgi:hypothetical protein
MSEFIVELIAAGLPLESVTTNFQPTALAAALIAARVCCSPEPLAWDCHTPIVLVGTCLVLEPVEDAAVEVLPEALAVDVLPDEPAAAELLDDELDEPHALTASAAATTAALHPAQPRVPAIFMDTP